MTVFSSLSGAAHAQATAWLQIEAQPSLSKAQERARDYATVFETVNGFALGSGWYAIALGPFDPAVAPEVLADLRGRGSIPRDSFVADGGNFRQQFWPVGASATITVQPIAPETTVPEPALPDLAIAMPIVPDAPLDETPEEARRSEGLLDRAARQLLQTALQWEGFYAAAIDGAFGPGTRNSMAQYQASKGYEATGVLTTAQRRDLIAAYEEVLAGIGMQTVTDTAAGIEIRMPTALVQFDHYEPPFVKYNGASGEVVQVLLISQKGDQDTLFGLYDIMQTLAIVPLDGMRERKSSSFVLTGENDEITSYTQAALSGGLIKGFTLVWPRGDEKRRDRVLDEMRASFTPLGDRALDDSLGKGAADQSINMLAGLEIRKPTVSRSGFYIDNAGTVLTTADAVANCTSVTIDGDTEMGVAMTDPVLGLAVLKPLAPLAPSAFARFRQSIPRLQQEVAVAGYPYDGALGAPTLTFGTLADIHGLNGEEHLQRLALSARNGDAGGAVIDSAGAVIGMLLPRAGNSAQQLPPEVSFAANTGAIVTSLIAGGITISATDQAGDLAAEDLTNIGMDMTVLVSCWN
ncbi:serine protease [Pseudogemmobacter sp. W21_MBD1_M6]|uniref:serine protease n=1 Tax=Pseudogemmobacter sp. W21_MBD1_M6 TaxID=3240271 RepID=UPI003F99C27E